MEISNIPMGYIQLDEGAAGNRYIRFDEFDALLNHLGDIVLGGDLNSAELIKEDLVKLHKKEVYASSSNVLFYKPQAEQVTIAPWTYTGVIDLQVITLTKNTWYTIVNLDDLIDDINYLGQSITKYFNLYGQQVAESGNHVQKFMWGGIGFSIGESGQSVFTSVTRVRTYVRKNPGQSDHGILWNTPSLSDEAIQCMQTYTPAMEMVVEQDSLSNNIAQRAIGLVEGSFVRR